MALVLKDVSLILFGALRRVVCIYFYNPMSNPLVHDNAKFVLENCPKLSFIHSFPVLKTYFEKIFFLSFM